MFEPTVCEPHIMALSNNEPHIATLLDLCAARQAGVTTYTDGKGSKPIYLSYSELRAVVVEKAERLRRYAGITPGKIILIHFKSHMQNIVWFWATTLAGYVPALSTSFVNDSEGRVRHFKHLHRLLLNPLVITKQELLDSDFVGNDLLQVVAVEAIENQRSPNIEVPIRNQTENSANALPNEHSSGIMIGKTDKHSNGHTNGIAKNLSDGLLNCRTDVLTNGFASKAMNGHTDSDTNSAICSLEGVAVLMLTSGSTGNAKQSVSLTSNYSQRSGGNCLSCPYHSGPLFSIGLLLTMLPVW